MKRTKFYSDVERKWVLIDARGQTLGRLARQIAMILRGKNKPRFSPNFLCGDKVVVINAKYIRTTGNKMKDKIYQKYTGYPSGLKEINMETLMDKNPGKVLSFAVKGMLPKNLLQKQMMRGLKIYPGSEHKQEAQLPAPIGV